MRLKLKEYVINIIVIIIIINDKRDSKSQPIIDKKNY